ncbi:putative Predicted acyl-CoA transferase/carnitine dehydratase [Candidatus Terasakiella magnetica]|uniref:Putative Predicted acyl-CoA transferase/carnitine dehydratase n=1 Tax=Candidatus Terasakiella magnetica TaxID=1867952 RepID=A0A1C3RD57_9PROT|nr:CoA transferase [Candidatus Terasakiella magnetica]SCA55206.1 putative Predicted acyl-CoA transferase/carnitine dehydratase [Candidatus Terasakiella magnetica]
MFDNCLDDILVLDLSQYIPGPFATMTLGDLGAEVIKIEPPFGDPMRDAFMQGEDGISPLYKQLNAGKKVVKIDLKSDGGKEALRALVKKADVLLESFRPGVMGRLGFDPKALKELNPKLIHCALSGYGQTGPYAQTAGHDMTYVALTGALSQTGHPDVGPVPIFPPLADHSGAMQAVSSILAALFRRERTGKGAFIDVSLFEAALSWNYLSLTPAGHGLEVDACGQGELTGGAAAWYGIYETKDNRFFAFAPIEPKFWQNFCKAVGRDDLLARHMEAQPQTDLIKTLRDFFKTKTLAQWSEVLLPADCCMEPIHTPDEVLNHPHVKERQIAFGNEIRYPAWVDHQPPKTRVPMIECDISDLL